MRPSRHLSLVLAAVLCLVASLHLTVSCTDLPALPQYHPHWFAAEDPLAYVGYISGIGALLHPFLMEIGREKYFRVFGVSLKQDCPFWDREESCTTDSGIQDHCAVVGEDAALSDTTFGLQPDRAESAAGSDASVETDPPSPLTDSGVVYEPLEDQDAFVHGELERLRHAHTGSHPIGPKWLPKADYNLTQLTLVDLWKNPGML